MADQSGLGALLSSASTGLLTLCAGMALVGVVLPSGEPSAYTSLDPAQPVRLEVPSLHIDADVVPIQLSPDGVLAPPGEVADVGWWDDSSEPGADRGQTVITGHSVHTGGGALDRLPRLHHGTIDVVTKAGTMRYQVTRAVTATHEQVATYAQGLFGQGRSFPDGPRLVLVTCTDYNGSYYEHNYIVFARPLGQPRADAERTTHTTRTTNPS